MIDETIINDLVETRDPVHVIWNKLNEIWQMPKITKNKIEELYLEKEKKTSEFEEAIFRIFFEFYDILVSRSKEFIIKNILKKQEYALIILDGLSIRESNFLLPYLKENFKIKNYTFTFSGIPSSTTSFCKNIFGYSHPSEIKNKKNLNFNYAHIAKEDDIRNLSGNRILVWSSLPDVLLHVKQKGSIQILPMSDVVLRTKDILFKIIENIDSNEIIVGSDHGYVYYKPETWWVLGKEEENILRKTFGLERSKNLKELPEETIKMFKDKTSNENPVIIDKEFLLSKGRFSWSFPGRVSPIRHGGVSLMENIIPYIHIQK